MKPFPHTLFTWLALSVCLFLAGCKQTTTTAPQPSERIEASAPQVWWPLRPTWLQLPNEAPSDQLRFYAVLTDSLEHAEVPAPHTEPSLPDRLRQAARLISLQLPPTLWRAEIKQAASDLADGKIRTIRVGNVEQSPEMIHNPAQYIEYDGVQDRFVHYTLENMSDIELRTSLVYALTERVHLRQLADLAQVSPRIFAFTMRVCTNLLAEFKVTAHLLGSEAQADWIVVDPGFQRSAREPSDSGVLIAPTDLSHLFTLTYPSVELLIGRRPREQKLLELMRNARQVGISQYPIGMGQICGRYVISRGPLQGRYLVPSDRTPEIVATLNRLSEIDSAIPPAQAEY